MTTYYVVVDFSGNKLYEFTDEKDAKYYAKHYEGSYIITCAK